MHAIISEFTVPYWFHQTTYQASTISSSLFKRKADCLYSLIEFCK